MFMVTILQIFSFQKSITKNEKVGEDREKRGKLEGLQGPGDWPGQ